VQGVGSSTGSIASIIGTLTSGVLFETVGTVAFYVSAAALALATWLFARLGRAPTPAPGGGSASVAD
jgi:hypothetical protein